MEISRSVKKNIHSTLSSAKHVHLRRQKTTAAEQFALIVVGVLVPVSLYGCNMYMMIHGSSFYNRLLAGECDSRWPSSN